MRQAVAWRDVAPSRVKCSPYRNLEWKGVIRVDEIAGCHDNEYEGDCLLGCCAV
jgi:hypothetical protein